MGDCSQKPAAIRKQCGICGKEFMQIINRHGPARFCRDCSKEYGSKKCEQILNGNFQQVCGHCKKEFSGRKRKFCSKQCKDAARIKNEDKEKRNARNRAWYRDRGGREWTKAYHQKNKDYKALQARLYKARHPEKIAERDTTYRNKRNQRIAEQSDGTAGGMIAKLMKLKRCQYCGHVFANNAEKRIDHRDPVSLGGLHSAANLELCCDQCNSRKSAMPFAELVARLVEPYRSKAISRAEKARGAPIHQHQLPLFGGAVIRKPREKAVNVNDAKRDALAAWRKWLYEMASDEWLDGYYANHSKPWTDHRLTDSQAFVVQYRIDPAFARRWNDARNARRRARRAEARISNINGRFFLEPNKRVASRAESNQP